MKLRFFTSRDWLPFEGCEYVHFLFPVWGGRVEDVYKHLDVYGNYTRLFPSVYELAEDMQGADFFVLPANIKHYLRKNQMDRVLQLEQLALNHGRKLLVFFKDDSDLEISLNPNCTVVFRTSFYASSRKANEMAMPVWSGDLISETKVIQFTSLPKPKFPRIGFCGQTIPSMPWPLHVVRVVRFNVESFLLRGGEKSIEQYAKRWFPFIRREVLEKFSSTDEVRTDFIERMDYFGGAWISKGVFDMHRYRQARKDYIQNLIRNDIFPCVRGGGNYTMRLFEVLCLGKIPILIETGTVLPFDDFIPWGDHILKCKLSEIPMIGAKVAAWFNALNEDEWLRIQEANRELWLRYLSPEGFFLNIGRYLVPNEK